VKVDNIIIDNKHSNSVSSVNVLSHINNFYQISKSFQNSGLDFFKIKKDDYHLELIYQMLTHILEDIDLIDSKKIEPFDINNIINYIKKLPLSQKININNTITSQQNTIVANRDIITFAILLLAFLQLDEHKLQRANLNLHLKGNRLMISIPTNMSYNYTQKSIILSKKVYAYKKSKRKFYGLYLLFLKKIINKIEGKIKILVNSDVEYRILLEIPVQSIIKDSIDNSSSILNTLNKRVIIYSNSKYISNKIKNYLKEYPLSVEIKIKQSDKAELPDFSECDLLIIDSSVIDSNIMSKLEQLKENKKKIILLADKDDVKKIEHISDTIIYKPFSYNELIFIILNMHLTDKNKRGNNASALERKEKKKQVIIADDIINLKLLEYKFREYDINTLTTTNGKEVLSILDKNGADLIIVDSIIPKMNGYEVAEAIRAQPRYRNIPIVIHSSFSLENYSVNDIFHYGFDAYLPKPFTNTQFNTIVTRYIKDIKNRESIREKKQFYQFYKDVDRVIEEYTDKNQVEALLSILLKLKEELTKIDAKNIIISIEKIIPTLNGSKYVDKNLIEIFIKEYRKFISDLSSLSS